MIAASLAPVYIIQSTHSQRIYACRMLVEMDWHADTCIDNSNILVVHKHDHQDAYSFDQALRYKNIPMVNATVAYEDLITHSTMIPMINQTTMINSIINILTSLMQCCLHGTTVNKFSKFLSHRPTEEDHTLVVHDREG